MSTKLYVVIRNLTVSAGDAVVAVVLVTEEEEVAVVFVEIVGDLEDFVEVTEVDLEETLEEEIVVALEVVAGDHSEVVIEEILEVVTVEEGGEVSVVETVEHSEVDGVVSWQMSREVLRRKELKFLQFIVKSKMDSNSGFCTKILRQLKKPLNSYLVSIRDIQGQLAKTLPQ